MTDSIVSSASPDDESLDLSWLDELEKAPKGSSGASVFSSREIHELAAPFIVRRCLAGQHFTTKDVLAGVPEFAVYKRPNAVGTALAWGVKGVGLGLHDRGGRFLACRENAGLILRAMQKAGKLGDGFAVACGHSSLGELASAVAALPSNKEAK